MANGIFRIILPIIVFVPYTLMIWSNRARAFQRLINVKSIITSLLDKGIES